MKSIEAVADEAARKTALSFAEPRADHPLGDLPAVPIRTKGPTMSKRDEAVEAIAQSLDVSYNPDQYPVLAAMFRDYAATAYDAALAVLQPTVPNDAEALEALPVGTVIRAVDDEGGVWVQWRLGRGSWHNGREGDADSDLARLAGDWGITEWRVIYTPEGDE